MWRMIITHVLRDTAYASCTNYHNTARLLRGLTERVTRCQIISHTGALRRGVIDWDQIEMNNEFDSHWVTYFVGQWSCRILCRMYWVEGNYYASFYKNIDCAKEFVSIQGTLYSENSTYSANKVSGDGYSDVSIYTYEGVLKIWLHD